MLAAAGCATLTGGRSPSAQSPAATDSVSSADSTAASSPTGTQAAAEATEAGKKGHERPEPPSGPVTITDVSKLKAMGPVYTPADIGPVLVPGDWLSQLLEDTLVPVIKKYRLSPDRATYYWVLLNDQGEVADVVLHTSSGQAAFDQAARAAALHLHYLPAHRSGHRVPVWVLVRVSLLMR